MHLHAVLVDGVFDVGDHLHENDREGIERLCRDGARGPLTLGKLTRTDHDTHVDKMKRTVRGSSSSTSSPAAGAVAA